MIIRYGIRLIRSFPIDVSTVSSALIIVLTPLRGLRRGGPSRKFGEVVLTVFDVKDWRILRFCPYQVRRTEEQVLFSIVQIINLHLLTVPFTHSTRQPTRLSRASPRREPFCEARDRGQPPGERRLALLGGGLVSRLISNAEFVFLRRRAALGRRSIRGHHDSCVDSRQRVGGYGKTGFRRPATAVTGRPR